MSKPKTGATIEYFKNPATKTTWTEAEIRAIARRYDRITTRVPHYMQWAKNEDPLTFITRYRHTAVVYGPNTPEELGPVEWDEFDDFVANDALLKRADGGYLRNVTFPNEYMVDPRNAWYQQWFKAFLDAEIALGYDGIFADLLGRPTYPPPWHYAPPRAINPRTGLEYTDAEFADDQINLVEALTGRGYPIIGNGIPQADDPYGYYHNQEKADIIINKLDGVMIEGPYGWGYQDFLTRSVEDWVDNVNLLKTINSRGKINYLMNHNISPVGTTGDAEALFTYCSFMIAGITNKAYMKYRGMSYMDAPFWQSLMAIDPGIPLTGILKIEGTEVYYKIYSNNVYYVNPDPDNSYTVNGTIMPPKTALLIEQVTPIPTPVEALLPAIGSAILGIILIAIAKH